MIHTGHYVPRWSNGYCVCFAVRSVGVRSSAGAILVLFFLLRSKKTVSPKICLDLGLSSKFYSHVGTEPTHHGLNNTVGSQCGSCSRTKHGSACGDITQERFAARINSMSKLFVCM